MARFFFLLLDHSDVEDSPEAREFPDVSAAVAAATQELLDFLADQVRHGYLDTDLRIEISDAQGGSVATVGFNEAVELRD